MSFSTAYLGLMNSTITVKTLTGLSADGYGDETYSTGTTYRARIVEKAHKVYTSPGVEEVANMLVYIASTSTFAPSSQIVMPDGSIPRLMQLDAFPDQDGIHHIRASFGLRRAFG